MVSGVLVIALFNILMGILILAFPNFLRFIVGAYFLISGILMLIFNV
ncbi:DUF3096 domain-containing protein [Candidatus Woesearchaeota archaeon]|nr:DUF3096 domain-containing protein [Candidatus Woesearchaeota archaeon]